MWRSTAAHWLQHSDRRHFGFQILDQEIFGQTAHYAQALRPIGGMGFGRQPSPL